MVLRTFELSTLPSTLTAKIASSDVGSGNFFGVFFGVLFGIVNSISLSSSVQISGFSGAASFATWNSELAHIYYLENIRPTNGSVPKYTSIESLDFSSWIGFSISISDLVFLERLIFLYYFGVKWGFNKNRFLSFRDDVWMHGSTMDSRGDYNDSSYNYNRLYFSWHVFCRWNTVLLKTTVSDYGAFISTKSRDTVLVYHFNAFSYLWVGLTPT